MLSTIRHPRYGMARVPAIRAGRDASDLRHIYGGIGSWPHAVNGPQTGRTRLSRNGFSARARHGIPLGWRYLRCVPGAASRTWTCAEIGPPVCPYGVRPGPAHVLADRARCLVASCPGRLRDRAVSIRVVFPAAARRSDPDRIGATTRTEGGWATTREPGRRRAQRPGIPIRHARRVADPLRLSLGPRNRCRRPMWSADGSGSRAPRPARPSRRPRRTCCPERR